MSVCSFISFDRDLHVFRYLPVQLDSNFIDDGTDAPFNDGGENEDAPFDDIFDNLRVKTEKIDAEVEDVSKSDAKRYDCLKF